MRKDLHMSSGKLAVQIAHCTEAYWTRLITKSSQLAVPSEQDCHHFLVCIGNDIFENYINESFVKTICEAKNKKHLLKAKDKALELGLIEGRDFGLIFDNCLTELSPEEDNGTTLTGVWFRPLPDDVAHSISKKYQLYNF